MRRRTAEIQEAYNKKQIDVEVYKDQMAEIAKMSMMYMRKEGEDNLNNDNDNDGDIDIDNGGDMDIDDDNDNDIDNDGDNANQMVVVSNDEDFLNDLVSLPDGDKDEDMD